MSKFKVCVLNWFTCSISPILRNFQNNWKSSIKVSKASLASVLRQKIHKNVKFAGEQSHVDIGFYVVQHSSFVLSLPGATRYLGATCFCHHIQVYISCEESSEFLIVEVSGTLPRDIFHFSLRIIVNNKHQHELVLFSKIYFE